ncbi:ABC transporter ATP-binding protein [Cellulosilyticum sp. ST5]|uniref:ABC transporter ATP-binding protein n=1 Tax=Cellulosilyticum sp. ST5 TaxID=3055805 RepID=UPI003977B830
MPMLEAKNATMQFGGLIAVNELNIEINEGEIVAIIGPNGAGKTTAFNMITGVYTPTIGSILFNGKCLNKMKPNKIAELGIARTFQNIRLFKNLTVLENVLIANHLRLKSGLFSSVLHLPNAQKEEKEMLEYSLSILECTGLLEHKDDIASSLPYGLQRRLEIARALATKPKLLLLDEPAAGMNPKESEDLTEFIRQIRNQFDLTILLIEHHMQLVMGISERIYVLEYGTTIAYGTPTEIQNNKAVIKAYLGEEE